MTLTFGEKTLFKVQEVHVHTIFSSSNDENIKYSIHENMHVMSNHASKNLVIDKTNEEAAY